ncbi:MAG TPA: PIN domain-containing protein [Bryobacteraceae bacterium]|nr:PIN domain-containing protein [Bryobacteraceae bacterium]
MSKVFFDTNLFIYLLEDKGERGAKVNALVQRLSERHDELLTSTLTLGEVLVKPLAANDEAWAGRYEALLNTPGVSLLPFDKSCARIYAKLREDRSVKAPDAVQLSCAANARCDLFITNDDRLSRKIVPGIQFIASFDRAFI